MVLIIPRITIPEINALVTEFSWKENPFGLPTKERNREERVKIFHKI